jgi:hypothetical protein
LAKQHERRNRRGIIFLFQENFSYIDNKMDRRLVALYVLYNKNTCVLRQVWGIKAQKGFIWHDYKVKSEIEGGRQKQQELKAISSIQLLSESTCRPIPLSLGRWIVRTGIICMKGTDFLDVTPCSPIEIYRISSETSVNFYRAACSHIPADNSCCENLRSKTAEGGSINKVTRPLTCVKFLISFKFPARSEQVELQCGTHCHLSWACLVGRITDHLERLSCCYQKQCTKPKRVFVTWG